MLTADQIDALRDRAGEIADPILRYLLEDIARRVAEAGQLTSTASYQVWRAQQLGLSQKEIKKRLQELLNASGAEIEKLLTQSAEVGYSFDLKHLPTAAAIPFEENAAMQKLVSAAVKLAQEDFTNLTQTLGMVDPYGHAQPLRDAYRQCMDYAFEQVFTGATDYNTAIRQATKNLADMGVRVIDYESGVHTSLEAAVRRNIMGGLGLMQEQISQQNHDEMGADGWEISAHSASAPDHEPIQGKQYGDEEFKRLNGSLKRRIGTLNCGHAVFPIILGVSQPQYTPEELEAMRQANARGVTVEGRHYSLYEATQMQRKMERGIRKQKKRILVDKATGDEEKLLIDQTKLRMQNANYKRFSEAAGLRTQRERVQVAGFGRKEAAEAQKAVAKYSKVRYNKDGTVVVTDDWSNQEKSTPPRKFRPNAVLQTKTVHRNGTSQIDRTIYDENGLMKTQIHTGPHNRPDKHTRGFHGEHAHDYAWDKDGARIGRTDRDLTDDERLAHADLLKGDSDGQKGH